MPNACSRDILRWVPQGSPRFAAGDRSLLSNSARIGGPQQKAPVYPRCGGRNKATAPVGAVGGWTYRAPGSSRESEHRAGPGLPVRAFVLELSPVQAATCESDLTCAGSWAINSSGRQVFRRVSADRISLYHYLSSVRTGIGSLPGCHVVEETYRFRSLSPKSERVCDARGNASSEPREAIGPSTRH